MNAARIENSKRLQRTLSALRKAGDRGLTTMELYLATGSMAVHSDVAELRAPCNDFPISCEMSGTNASGRRVYTYRLVKAEAA